MKKFGTRLIPAALALSLCTAPVMAYAEFTAEPGNPYDAATMERLADNTMEYGEIEQLVDMYSPSMKTLKDSYSENKNASKDVVKLKEQLTEQAGVISDAASDLKGTVGMVKDTIGMNPYVTPDTYASMVYNSELLDLQAEQVLLMGDSMTEISPEMMKIKVVDTNRALLISGAQSAMIGREQLLLQKEGLTETISLLEVVYKSVQTQAALGMATESDVLNAKQNLESAQAGMLTMEASEQKIRQSLCTLLGWKYDANPDIRPVPAADLSRIDRMNPEQDKVTAWNNNFTLKYNLLDYEKKNDGSVEQQSLSRTIDQQREQIASSMVNLYNDVLQKRNELQTAKAAYELEKTKMDAAERKMQVGTIGRLEYLQQKNALKTKEVAAKNADLALFQAMETYDWAVSGNLSVS